MAEPEVLWAAWARVAAGSGMPGADGLSVADFARDLGPRLDRLADQLAEGRYEPQPLRQATITRGGRRRPLGLPTVRDRVAQRAFLDVCHDELDADVVEVSFAYRRGRSWLDALAAAERHRDEGRRVVPRTDIAATAAARSASAAASLTCVAARVISNAARPARAPSTERHACARVRW
ncbi:hypothetical protein I6A60_06025 [Frankia sp. AgB1.9]|uniref:hypothetical protein n=1 Tax=unclassified Frankia TaxID=2632575 RepID=UPI001933B50A|nr:MULTISPECIES: hypothetical protein [unclassified Frankia]MBL7487476.1 hypothetical protein [Frankia sp. AgW1.1]MBL7547438.1 hypothetical protein [Frankia sp. AgB1.9]MBL7618787.1 hypothetical protein [Frankia sp. AgB1.8]